MPTLKQVVIKGLEEMGLSMGEDRGALVVSGVNGSDLKAQVFVDENERLVRMETLLVHPVEELSPELSLALHYLNGHRAGVGYAFRESNRAVVARASWSSPSRDPSENQLHLMVALLTRSLQRDADKLNKVAEGEASWDSVAEGDAPSGTGQAPSRPPSRSAMPTARIEEPAEPPTRVWPGGGGGAGITSKSGGETTRWNALMDVASDADAASAWRRDAAAGVGSAPPRRPTGNFRRDDVAAGDPPSRKPGDPPSRKAGDPPSRRAGDTEADEPRKLSRQALAMAISHAEKSNEAPKVDLANRRGGGAVRLLKSLFVIGVLVGVTAVVLKYFVIPFYPNLFGDLFSSFQAQVVGQEELKRQARATKAGEELLLTELQDPMQDAGLHQEHIQRAVAGLGDKANDTIEGIVARQPAQQVRDRAFKLWQERVTPATDPGGRLRLLKLISDSAPPNQSAEDPIEGQLLTSLRQGAPADAELIKALEWAKDGTWVAIIELLGKPGEGAQARAKALEGQRAKDGPKLQVLEALMRTGHGPVEGAKLLVEGLGTRWAQGDGKTLLLGLVKSQPPAFEKLLESESDDVKLATIELLAEGGGPGAVDLLCKVTRSDASTRLRQKAVIGLGVLAAPAATWTLAQELGRKSDPAVMDEVRTALKKIGGEKAAGELKEHLAPTCPVPERQLALVALEELHHASAVQVIVDKGIKDPDEKIRIKAFEVLIAQQSEAKGQIGKGTATYRDLSQRDPNEKVRQLADRLYKAIIGR